MSPILNGSLLSDLWKIYPETRSALENWLTIVKASQILDEVLCSFLTHSFQSADERTVIFRLDRGVSLLVRFPEKGGLEVQSVKYKTFTQFPTDVFH